MVQKNLNSNSNSKFKKMKEKIKLLKHHHPEEGLKWDIRFMSCHDEWEKNLFSDEIKNLP